MFVIVFKIKYIRHNNKYLKESYKFRYSDTAT